MGMTFSNPGLPDHLGLPNDVKEDRRFVVVPSGFVGFMFAFREDFSATSLRFLRF
jgi:hypothetical protein